MVGYILQMKIKTFLFSAILLSGLVLLIYQEELNEIWFSQSLDKLPKIIWWTPFSKFDELKLITCGDYKCGLTDDRKYLNDPHTSAFLFYGSQFIPYDLPLPRKKFHIWAIIHEESPKNLALFLHKEAFQLFNFSSTFSRHSNLPLTLQHLPNIDLISDMKYFVATEKKNTLLKSLAPILYIQSDCETPLERDSYVTELMKYIPVDSYGKCINNKKLPEKFTINPLEDLYAEEFMNFVAQYKFSIAFENAICEDYITEKLWRPLIAGSVPIYMGSPTVQDWLPNKDTSAILAKNYDSPKKLANYILKLNSNDQLYENYLQHKLSDYFKITNSFLYKIASTRKWGIDTDFHFFNAFECLICENIHKNIQNDFINVQHYNCPEPISPLTKKANISNWWRDHWRDGKCEAKVLNNFVKKYKFSNFTQKMYEDEVKKC